MRFVWQRNRRPLFTNVSSFPSFCFARTHTRTNTRRQTHTATAINATLYEVDTQSWVLSCHFKSLFLTRLNYVCIFTCTSNAYLLRIHMYLSENYQKPLFSHSLENFGIMAVWIRTHTRAPVSQCTLCECEIDYDERMHSRFCDIGKRVTLYLTYRKHSYKYQFLKHHMGNLFQIKNIWFRIKS